MTHHFTITPLNTCRRQVAVLSVLLMIGWLVATPRQAFATSRTWLHTTGNWDWLNGSNWSGGVVPSSNDDAIVDNGTAYVFSGSNNISSLTVGNSGTGCLILNHTDGGITVGGGTGTLTLAKNAGSVGTLYLGDSYQSSGAGVLDAGAVIGGNGSATVNFRHTGSYTFSPNLVGNLSVNKLLSGTTVLTGSNNYSGLTTVSAGELDVYGSLSTTGSIVVGGSTGAAFGVKGGVVNNYEAYIGEDAGSFGAATVTSGTWNANNGLTVGYYGTGSLTISGSGVVNVGYGGGTLVLAHEYGSVGTLNMGDGDTVGTLNAAEIDGDWSGHGTATVNFNHAGSYTFSPNIAGGSINKLGSGTTTLAGNYYWTNSMTVSAGELDVALPFGNLQTGSIVVGGSTGAAFGVKGGVVNNYEAYIGEDAGSFGAATVTSGTWNANNGLYVGQSGTGALTIKGGVVNSDSAYIGRDAGSFGTATITSGTWTSKYLWVGGNGTGTLTIAGDGVVQVGSGDYGENRSFYLAHDYGSVGTLNMGDGDTVGTLNVYGISNVLVGSGTATVNFNHAGNYTFIPSISGNLSINKLGSGTTTLAGSYQVNSMTVSAGELSVSYSLGANTPISVSAGAVLSGSGTINVGVAVDGTLKGTLHTGAISGSGLVSPGNSPGILTATSINPTGGMSFAFEFTLANTNPVYSNAAASCNDILHLTGASPFSDNLTADNLISIYLQSAVAGDSYLGGFFTGLSDAQLEAVIQNAKFAFFVEDDVNGTMTFNGKTYSSISAALIGMGTTQVNGANFADGTVNGSTLKLMVVPEPSTWWMLTAGMVILFRLKSPSGFSEISKKVSLDE